MHAVRSRLASCQAACWRQQQNQRCQRLFVTAASEAGSEAESQTRPRGPTETDASYNIPSPQSPAAPRKARLFSGVQPTGVMHLGNYLGAIKSWVKLQELYDTFYCIVDMHAITLQHEPKELLEATRRTAALYLACGVNPEVSSIFVQSHVPAHAELAWLLSCVTPIGWLRRMTQFKEKSARASDASEVGTGLLTYPVLMAADILLYQSELVPVGHDQKAHIELARDIAERTNRLYGNRQWKKLGGKGGKLFRIPDVFLPPVNARVMSLQDGTSKMSKSAESDMSRINLLDDPKLVKSKIQKAKSDGQVGLEFDNPDRPEANNLLGIYQTMSGISKDAAQSECKDLQWGEFKFRLAEAISEHLRPIQDRYKIIMDDRTVLDQVLQNGADVAAETAARTLFNEQAQRDAEGSGI
ncbi:hypothetical protein WJX73_008036 [Symbiochloris irregularis]|uniref:tryptophan--tRNA ligase n=1 Tax=Symbiochloris irregularis TaxID=706552 RepID=A0AAW1P623_9CHLO